MGRIKKKSKKRKSFNLRADLCHYLIRSHQSTLESCLKADLRYFIQSFPQIDVGKTVPLLDVLFTDQRNFLITNNGHQVTSNDLKGKTIIVYMLSLTEKNCRSLLSETANLIEFYNELHPMGGFELVFAPKRLRESTDARICGEDRFNNLFSSMPWPAVPFYDKQTCERLEETFCLHERLNDAPYWAIIDPMGKILFTHGHYFQKIFNYYGGDEFYPLNEDTLLRLLYSDADDKAVNGVINLDKLLSSPTRNFLLTSDGEEVLVSSLKDKVVGLYFCENTPNPPRMEAIKKVYQQAMDLKYNFEIVQITFNCRSYEYSFPYTEDKSLEPYFENVPWLTLPFKDPCWKRLRRLFKLHKYLSSRKEDSLIIIDPHQANSTGKFFEYHGANIIVDFGIEAYPFTQRRVLEMKEASKKEVTLHVVFPPSRVPFLIRPRSGGGCDRVPISQLWGKQVLIVFATRSKYKSSGFVSKLASKYILQRSKNESEFEVVYVSCNKNASKFDECIKDMPWLVHPYCWDFAEKWRSKLFKNGVKGSIVAFGEDGELLARRRYLQIDILEEYPYFSDDLDPQNRESMPVVKSEYYESLCYPF